MSTINYEKMGQKIKESRERQKITQATLAEYCSLSTSYIGHIERGSRIPSIETLYRISEILNLSLDYLVLDSDNNTHVSASSIDDIIKSIPKEKQSSIIKILKFIIKSEPI